MIAFLLFPRLCPSGVKPERSSMENVLDRLLQPDRLIAVC
jgi:hypothetical protein